MKKIVLILFLILISNFYSQKINYDNFDIVLANDALSVSFLKYRDTITHLTSNPKYSYSIYAPEMNNVKGIRNPLKSDILYKNYSFSNCSKLLCSNSSDHIDVTESFKKDKQKFIEEGFKYEKNISEKIINTSRVNYGEVLFICEDKKFDTYQELADFIILSFDKSSSHSSILRGQMHSNYLLETYNITTVTGLFSCCVLYDKNKNKFISTINIVTII